MNKKRTISVYAPASIGNFSVGFDVLGLAVAPVDGELLGDVVHAAPAPTYALTVTGPYVRAVPAGSDNLVTRAYLAMVQALAERQRPSVPLALTLEKRLPVGSGLGSSASSIVAALVAINHAWGKPLDDASLLQLAGRLEGTVSGDTHFDNVAPSLLGGLQLMSGQEACPSHRLPFPGSWWLVVSYPGTAITTRQARDVLPASVPMCDAVAFGRNMANFVHALDRQDAGEAARFVTDPLAEPYRRQLLPGFAEFSRQAREAGALAVGISGSGPSVFALCDGPKSAQAVQELALAGYCACPDADKTAFSWICRQDDRGACRL